MIGIENLIKMRMQGKRPDHVWINFKRPCVPIKYEYQWQGMELEYRHIRDLRPFVGMTVLIHSQAWTKPVAELYDGLQGYADWIYVFIDDYEEDLGWKWNKKLGRIDFE
jgi:hypothetical protein